MDDVVFSDKTLHLTNDGDLADIAWSIWGTGELGDAPVVFDHEDKPVGGIQSITIKGETLAEFVILRPFRLGGGLGRDESGRYIREGV